MGYLIVIDAYKPIEEDVLYAWRDTVPERKRAPLVWRDAYTIWVTGSYSNCDYHTRWSFVHRMIRHFGKVHGIKLSAKRET